jgi:ribosomal protein L1
MAKLSKRVKAFREKVDPSKNYAIGEAVTILNELSSVKFKESIDVSINLGRRPSKVRSGSSRSNCIAKWYRQNGAGCGVCPG